MFFKDSEEIQEYVDINMSFDYKLIKPKLNQVDSEVLKLYFGSPFINDLQTLYDGTTAGDISTLTAPQQKAIKLMRSISAPLAVALWVTPGQLQIDNAGIFIARNENRATAFEWQIKDLIKSYLKPGYKAIEEAIEVLHANIGGYALYASYEEYAYYKSCFIKDSKQFTKLYSPLNNSYLSYLMLRSCMDKVVDLDIQSVLLPTYFTALKTRISAGTTTAEDNAILPMIKMAIANLTIFKAISELGATFDEHGFMEFDNTSGVKSGASNKTAKGETIIRLANSIQESGATYLSKIKAYLEANKTSYSEYTSDSAYISDQPSAIENSTDQSYFIGM